MVPQKVWGLWSVRRSDIQQVWNEGFDMVRPTYPVGDAFEPGRSGSWQDQQGNTHYYDKTDNYATALSYAQLAQSIGFTKLIYDSGLIYLYTEYRRWVQNNNYPTPYTSIQAIQAEIDRHFGEMSALSGIDCHPYIDEPDLFGQETLIVDGQVLWYDYIYSTDDLRQLSISASQSFDVWNNERIPGFKSIVDYAKNKANSLGKQLIVASAVPDIERAYFLFSGQEDYNTLSVARKNDFPTYYYNNAVDRIMSSLYKNASAMANIIPAINSNYGNRFYSQLINFFDIILGGTQSGTSVQDIIDQINTNSPYSGSENWFYQGDCISLNVTVNGVNSQTQWNNLIQAIRSFGTQPRA